MTRNNNNCYTEDDYDDVIELYRIEEIQRVFSFVILFNHYIEGFRRDVLFLICQTDKRCQEIIMSDMDTILTSRSEVIYVVLI